MLKEFGDSRNEKMYVVRVPEIENGDFAISSRIMRSQLERCASTDEAACEDCIFGKMAKPWYLCGRLMAKTAAVVIEGLENEKNGILPFKIGDKLYFISRNKVHERMICGCIITEQGYEIKARMNNLVGSIRFYEKDVGNTVFFDEKEAFDKLDEENKKGKNSPVENKEKGGEKVE